jgi:hypothetical protein
MMGNKMSETTGFASGAILILIVLIGAYVRRRPGRDKS